MVGATEAITHPAPLTPPMSSPLSLPKGSTSLPTTAILLPQGGWEDGAGATPCMVHACGPRVLLVQPQESTAGAQAGLRADMVGKRAPKARGGVIRSGAKRSGVSAKPYMAGIGTSPTGSEHAVLRAQLQAPRAVSALRPPPQTPPVCRCGRTNPRA